MHDTSNEMIVDPERPKPHENLSSVSGPKGDTNEPASVTMAALNKNQSCRDDFVFHPPDHAQMPSKRLRVSDINVSRYEEEFVEIEELASGVFGKVKVARHRLDGMVYAIKVIRDLDVNVIFAK